MRVPPKQQSERRTDETQAPMSLRDPRERSEVFHEIVAAQQELLQARGRLLEATTDSDVAEVLASLDRVHHAVARAHEGCARWTNHDRTLNGKPVRRRGVEAPEPIR